MRLTPIMMLAVILSNLVACSAASHGLGESGSGSDEPMACDLIVRARLVETDTRIIDEGLHRDLMKLAVTAVLFGSVPDPSTPLTAYTVGGIRSAEPDSARSPSQFWCLKDLSAHGLPYAVMRRGDAEQARHWPRAGSGNPAAVPRGSQGQP